MASKKPDPNLAQQLYVARQLAEQGSRPTDDEFATQFPALWELMTTWWLDPIHRIEAARLEVQCISGDWLFKLSSPSMRGHKQVLVPVFGAGLRALDLVVADPASPWLFWLKRRANIAEVKPSKNGLTP